MVPEESLLFEFGNFRFDPANHLLLKNKSPVSLTPKAFDILLVLIQNGSRLTSKEELMRRVWPDSFVEEANLTVNISALRRTLGELPDGSSYIETIPRKGYRFVAPIKTRAADNSADSHDSGATEQSELLNESSAAKSNEADVATNPASNALGSPAMFVRILLGVSMLLILGIGYLTFHRTAAPDRARPQVHRLAVLPFQNLQQKAENDFLGFSLADAVISKLGYVSELTVRPSYSVQKYKSQPIDMRQVASDLNVDTVLTGTFLRDGDDLRIACQLVNVQKQNILWKGTFDLKYDKLLTVQDKVANQIIRGLELSLSPSESERLRLASAADPAAYEFFLRGIDLYANGNFPLAIKMLERSVELGPNYAPAWANLGRALTAYASFQLAGGDQYRKAEAAFNKALALRPADIEASIYMANMLTDTGRVEEAIPLLRSALKTNPNIAEIHWELGYAYRFAGMLQESVAEAELARKIDPGVKATSSTMNSYLYLGEYDKFLQSLPHTDIQSLIVFYRGFGEYYKKEFDKAADDFDHAFELDRNLLQAQTGRAFSLGLKGKQREGLGILQAVENAINDRGVGDAEANYKIAQAYASLGNKPAALRVLGRSIDKGFFPSPYFDTDPLLDSLRGSVPFNDLIASAHVRHEKFKKAFF